MKFALFRIGTRERERESKGWDPFLYRLDARTRSFCTCSRKVDDSSSVEVSSQSLNPPPRLGGRVATFCLASRDPCISGFSACSHPNAQFHRCRARLGLYNPLYAPNEHGSLPSFTGTARDNLYQRWWHVRSLPAPHTASCQNRTSLDRPRFVVDWHLCTSPLAMQKHVALAMASKCHCTARSVLQG